MTMPITDQNAKLHSPTGNKREENKQKEQTESNKDRQNFLSLCIDPQLRRVYKFQFIAGSLYLQYKSLKG